MRFRASDIASLVGGTLTGSDVDVVGASIDSRVIAEQNVFVAIVADRDGHDFIPMAVAGGAAACLTDRPSDLGTAIQVADTAAALTALGSAARDRLPDPVIGVTGSVGKTSVKDLTAAACAAARPTHANPASFNNELGLPLTLVNAPDDTEVTVLEMGARGEGHIASLCAVGRPTIGVVTRVAGAHTELFGSLEAVAQAKGELIECLPPGGVAVLNADDERVAAMATRSQARVLTYGWTGDVRLLDAKLDELLRPTVRVLTPSGEHTFPLQLSGMHMAHNAVGALAAAIAAEVPIEAALEGLAGATLSAWRMDVRRSAEGGVVINDAYNANPTSVRAALASLVGMGAQQRVAVLGLMAELGDEHAAEHEAVAVEAAGHGVRVIAVAAPDYGEAAEHVADIDEALAALGGAGPGTAVLVKGSRVAGLEQLAARLL